MSDVNGNRVKWEVLVKGIILSAVLCSIVVSVKFLLIDPYHKSKDTISRSEELCTTNQCLKQVSRILRNMDNSVDPCIDFYNFTCGNFMQHSVIPQDQTRLLVILENIKMVEEELLKAYNADPKIFIQPIREIKTFYNQCIDSRKNNIYSYPYKRTHNENSTIKHVKQMLIWLKWPILISSWNDAYSKTFNWLDMETNFNKMGLAPVFLSTELKFDMRNFTTAYIGIDCTVPKLSKEMYSNSEVFYVFKTVTQKFLDIIGSKYNQSDIDEILNFFLKVEKLKPTIFEMSDSNFFNSFETVQVGKLGNKLNIDITKFLNRILPSSVEVSNNTIIGTNTYQCLISMTSMVHNADKRITANYMIWEVIQNLFWIISEKTRTLDFLLSKIQTGVEAPLPLNKLCLNYIDDQLPELSSAMYIKINYSPTKKKSLKNLVILLIKELMKAIKQATWMDGATKKMAKEKVRKLTYIISYEDEAIKDKYLNSIYKNLKMTNDIFKNVRNIKRLTYEHNMETLHWSAEKRNRASLLPLAHVINAFYHPGLNAIAIPAGIAHGYIYSEKQEAYSNFGAIGIIIGHELSHVFDNVGRLYDSRGRYTNWWSDRSNMKFIEKSQCFIKQYNNFTLGGKAKINGTLTLGENMADAGGMLLAYYAFLEWNKKYKIKKSPGLENFTTEQLFWISLGNTWCDKLRPERLDMFLKTDVHSTGNFRVLGPLSNSKEFSRDFNCPENSYMNRKQKCTIW